MPTDGKVYYLCRLPEDYDTLMICCEGYEQLYYGVCVWKSIPRFQEVGCAVNVNGDLFDLNLFNQLYAIDAKLRRVSTIR